MLACSHGMSQDYPTAYGSQYPEPRYFTPGVVSLTYGGHVPHNYHNASGDWHMQTDPYPDMNTMGYSGADLGFLIGGS